MARLFVNQLTVIDFSFMDSIRGVVGESWIVDIELHGELDEQGMVFDFGSVKKEIKQFIDNHIDHRLLVPIKSHGCNTSYIHENDLLIDFPLSSGAIISHQSPAEAVLLVETEKIEVTHLTKELQCQLLDKLPENINDIAITLRTESIEGAYYQYTHGLQEHLGQCQRIAHGHRSKIEISVDGKRNPTLENHWANRLADNYIANEDHIVEIPDINGIPHTRLAYSAAQGDFSITLPSAQAFTIPKVSTVENIAKCLAEYTANKNAGDILVKAFEGVNKGAFGIPTS